MPQMLRMSVRVADGIMMSDMPAALAADAVKQLDDGLACTRKSRPRFHTNMFAAWHVYPDEAAARAEARRWLVLRGIFRPWVLETFLDDAGVAQVMRNADAFWSAFRSGRDQVVGVDDAVLDALVDNLTFVGSTSDIGPLIGKLNALAAAGLGSVSLRLYERPAESIRLIGKEILPIL